MITFRAEAGYANAGKQHIARITGRDAKFTFSREFVGTKGGKRGDVTTADLDTQGLYECRDVNNKGVKDDDYRLILQWEDRAEIGWVRIDKADAMKIAKELDAGRAFGDIVEPVCPDPEVKEAAERIAKAKESPSPYPNLGTPERDAWETEKKAADDALSALIAAGKKKRGWQFRTAKEAAKVEAAHTLQTATDACWAAMQALPAKDAKKILATLKARLTPPAPVSEAADATVQDGTVEEIEQDDSEARRIAKPCVICGSTEHAAPGHY